MRSYGLPDKYEARIERALAPLGYSLSQPKKLAEAILRLSDHYQVESSTSPWEHDWAKAAYLSYFFPLNYARSHSVIVEGAKRGFFTGLENVIDFGSGTGAAMFAAADSLMHSWAERLCYEPNSEALDLHDLLNENDHEIKSTMSEPHKIKPKTLGIFSYSLNELETFPPQFLEADALMLIEPSTRAHGRRLLQLRDDLILNRGFYAWAPCPHQGPCPLLNNSERDWCHDRIAWQAPPWFLRIETVLPIKNPTLTYSYVLLKKTPPETKVSEKILGRVVGDALAEKGKTRQLICFDSQRRFLSWFPQRLDRATLKHFDFDRGDLLELETNLEERGNEMRVKETHQIAKLI